MSRIFSRPFHERKPDFAWVFSFRYILHMITSRKAHVPPKKKPSPKNPCNPPLPLLPYPNRSHTHPGTDAHTRDSHFRVPAPQLIQQCGDLSCTGAAEGMPEGDGAAVGVHLMGIQLNDDSFFSTQQKTRSMPSAGQ